MRIDAVELRRVRLPLVTPFRTSFGTQLERDALLVTVRTPDADGWGECVAMAWPGYSSEWIDGAHEVTRRFLVPSLVGSDVAGADVGARLAAVVGHPMAKAALELAILDAELRAASTSLRDRLGGTRTRVDVGVSVGITDTLDALISLVGGYVAEGYRRIKLKIEPGWDVAPVRAVREKFGDDLMLQADANTAYTLDDADALVALDPFDLLLVEQPLPEDDLLGHAELARRLRTPICLDESILSAASARLAIEIGACRIVNIKAPRVGGYLEAVRVHDVCVAHGVPVWCGGMLETGVGRAANLALAALEGFTLPGDISGTARYFARDVTPPFVAEDGTMEVPDGAGLGVEIDQEFLAEVTTSVEVLRP